MSDDRSSLAQPRRVPRRGRARVPPRGPSRAARRLRRSRAPARDGRADRRASRRLRRVPSRRSRCTTPCVRASPSSRPRRHRRRSARASALRSTRAGARRRRACRRMHASHPSRQLLWLAVTGWIAAMVLVARARRVDRTDLSLRIRVARALDARARRAAPRRRRRRLRARQPRRPARPRARSRRRACRGLLPRRAAARAESPAARRVDDRRAWRAGRGARLPAATIACSCSISSRRMFSSSIPAIRAAIADHHLLRAADGGRTVVAWPEHVDGHRPRRRRPHGVAADHLALGEPALNLRPPRVSQRRVRRLLVAIAVALASHEPAAAFAQTPRRHTAPSAPATPGLRSRPTRSPRDSRAPRRRSPRSASRSPPSRRPRCTRGRAAVGSDRHDHHQRLLHERARQQHRCSARRAGSPPTCREPRLRRHGAPDAPRRRGDA